MFTGKQITPRQAKVTLKKKGWTYRAASPVLDVTYQHICLVLTGRRQSLRLLAKIDALPERKAA